MNMNSWLLSPPVAFILMLAFAALLSYLFSKLAFKKKGEGSSGAPYACGEDSYDAFVAPDYSQFFPFAFFFTIAHVATLVIATVPAVTASIMAYVAVYLLAILIGLFILLWR